MKGNQEFSGAIYKGMQRVILNCVCKDVILRCLKDQFDLMNTNLKLSELI